MTREHVIVAAATRGRPELFQSLLVGLAQLTPPEGVSLSFLFVQNEGAFTIEPEVAIFARQAGRAAEALHVPEAGIPLARNAAVEAALARGADWLAFIDDDERPEPGWIAALVAGARAGGLDLCGGPVRPVPPRGRLTAAEAGVMAFLEAQAAARGARRAGGDVSALPTSNWICRRAVLDSGLRFDPGLRFAGGSDTDFSDRAEAAGWRLGWVPEAVVTEVQGRERLTGAYVYRRAKSQTLAKYALRYRKRGRRALGRALFHGLSKGLAGALRVALGPAGSGRRLRGLRSLGVAAGWLGGAIGAESRLYAPRDRGG